MRGDPSSGTEAGTHVRASPGEYTGGSRSARDCVTCGNVRHVRWVTMYA